MTKRTIMDMAQEAGICRAENNTHWAAHGYELEAFAALVREDEREICAKVCEDYTDKSAEDFESHGYICAEAIRKKGQA